ncbi:MAG: potassium-transporting ATPase subunit KdpC [Anaerolinea sp.]|nr:potassium-transporting ATPase subunit KdpC [Anaerolinea sp.]
MRTLIRPTVVALALLVLLTGVVYPLTVTALAQLIMPRQANGSLVQRAGVVVGSELIGQAFDDPRYFWGRPSATAPFPYNGAASSGSNLGPSNAALTAAAQARLDALQAANAALGLTVALPVPVDLVTASASGLDPHISPAAAAYQTPRVAAARGLSEAQVRALVEQHTAGRQFGLLGEPRVDVLELNLALDGLQ